MITWLSLKKKRHTTPQNQVVQSLVMILFVSSIARGQSEPSSLAPQTKANTATESSSVPPSVLKEFESIIERRAKNLLTEKTNALLSQRLSRSSFNVSLALALNKAKLKDWLHAFGESDFQTLKSEIGSRDYEGIRSFLQSADIDIGFSNRISEVEWAPILDSVKNAFDGGSGSVESVSGNSIALPLSPEERAIQLQMEEAKKNLERSFQLRKEELSYEKQLEVEKAKKIQDIREEELKAELKIEKEKRESIINQFVNDQNIKEKVVKDWPVLSRFIVSGLGIGLTLLFAAALMGLLIFFAIRSFGSSLMLSYEGIADALKEGKETTLIPKNLDPFTESGPDAEEKRQDTLIEFDTKPELKEAAEQLRVQVTRDLFTTAAVLSKVVEQEKFGEVVGVFDILGPDLSQKIFDEFTSSAKRGLQRAFFNGEIKRVPPASLFNRINELRTMLSTTDVLMRDKSDKTFAQIALSYSDEEISKGLNEISIENAAEILTIFPPDRMFKILRRMHLETSKGILEKIGLSIHRGAKISSDVIDRFASGLFDETKMRYEEHKRYFRSLIANAEEEEVETISRGLEFHPKLLLDVIGIRATIDDLWAQNTEHLDRLLSLVELEPSAFLLSHAPEQVRNNILQTYPERKRLLTLDALSNFESDKELRAQVEKTFIPTRRTVLDQLSQMAKQGLVQLPSYERLLKMVSDQEARNEVTSQPLPTESAA